MAIHNLQLCALLYPIIRALSNNPHFGKEETLVLNRSVPKSLNKISRTGIRIFLPWRRNTKDMFLISWYRRSVLTMPKIWWM